MLRFACGIGFALSLTLTLALTLALTRCAVLRYACGTQRQQGYARLQAAITDGDVSTAASVAQAHHAPQPHPLAALSPAHSFRHTPSHTQPRPAPPQPPYTLYTPCPYLSLLALPTPTASRPCPHPRLAALAHTHR